LPVKLDGERATYPLIDLGPSCGCAFHAATEWVSFLFAVPHLADGQCEDSVTIRVHSGTKSLKGSLASDKGRGLSFGQIRRATGVEANRGRPK
jgi:hypothetical protein